MEIRLDLAKSAVAESQLKDYDSVVHGTGDAMGTAGEEPGPGENRNLYFLGCNFVQSMQEVLSETPRGTPVLLSFQVYICICGAPY